MRTRLAVLIVLLTMSPAAARVDDTATAFASGPLIHQLLLTPQGQTALSGALSGRVLHRYVSDDGAIVVDLVVRSNVIEQQIMYVPMDMQRGYQVGMFLQDAVGSVVGAQKGMIAYRAAVINRKETYLTFGPYAMRFTPLDPTRLRVLVSR